VTAAHTSHHSLRLRARAYCLGGWLLISVAWPAHGAELPSINGREQLEELQRLAREAGIDLGLSAWDFSSEFEFGAGYEDNVGLSALTPDATGLLRGNASGLAWRLPDNGFDWVNFADLTYTRFFSAAESDHAVLAMLGSEARWTGSPNFEYELAGRYTYQDEVLDASSAFDEEAQLVRARLQTAQIEPSLRWKLAPGWALVCTAAVERLDLLDSDYDQTEFEFTLGLERRLARAGVLTLLVGHVSRDYGDREQLNAAGNVIAGSRLDITQNWAELKHELRWGKRIKWRAKTRANLLRNDDNGEGWFDYQRRGIVGMLTADAGAWHVEFDAAVRHYRYRLQTAFAFGNPPPRRRTGSDATVRVLRDLSENFAVFAECAVEQSRSNDAFLKYDDFVTILGVRMSR
jgi:hypothetical protein